jgi:predicted KAP-like P-loop ATPase
MVTDNQNVKKKIQIKQDDCKKKIFNADNPIKDKKDDILGRTQFAEDISLSLLNYKTAESIIIGLNGEWGSGKSSVINLIKQCINNNSSDNTDKPVIIDFNPWMFSKREDITKYFFDEIRSAFSCYDKTIAKKIKRYSNLLSGLKDILILFEGSSQVVLIIKNLLCAVKWFNHFIRSPKSLMDIKNELNADLIKNKRNIIVFIDDIDRLTGEEIRELFRLVRVNADFAKIIYVIAFDRRIVEKSFEDQGKKYLEKIIQVNINVPFLSKERLSKFLLKELDRVIKTLPSVAQEYFNKDEYENNWDSIYRSGFRDFFKNIRDIKRFISGLEFNISRMCKNDVIEINPIDFIAVEAIRMFSHDFYLFMVKNSDLFTATTESRAGLSRKEIKEEIDTALNCIVEDNVDNRCRRAVKGLVKELFPQLGDIVCDSSIMEDKQKQLRICSEQFYDSYFNFIPGGDEGEISRYEITGILKKMNFMETFEQFLRKFMKTERIGRILGRIQDFTGDEKYIPKENVKNVIGALFNIYEGLSDISALMNESIFDSYTELSAGSIIYQLLNRESDKEKNFDLLKELIPKTKGLSIQFHTSAQKLIQVPIDKVISLQKICVEKINNADKKYLINHKKLRFLLYKWKEWGGLKQLTEFINQVLESDENTIVLVSNFISKKIELRNYKMEGSKELRYKDLGNFVNLGDVKTKLDKIKKSSPELYKEHKDTIDLFLKDWNLLEDQNNL